MTIKELMAFHTATPINSLYDLINLLRGNTRNLVTMFSKEDVVSEKASLPMNLRSLKGALKMHELVVSSEGKIGAKKLPSDKTFAEVNLAPSFAIGLASASPAERLQVPEVEIHPTEGVEE